MHSPPLPPRPGPGAAAPAVGPAASGRRRQAVRRRLRHRSSTARRSTAGRSSPRPGTAAPARTRPAAGGSSRTAPSSAARTCPATAASSSPRRSTATSRSALEMNNDFGPDSGLFLRSTEDGKCYQAMIDYHADGNLMGVYGEGHRRQAARPQLRLHRQGDRDQGRARSTSRSRCRSTPEEWPKFWKHGEWNELRARIEGNPPKLTTWIKGVKFMEFTDTEKRLRRQGRHRPAGPRRRRLHEAVRPLPEHPGEGAEVRRAASRERTRFRRIGSLTRDGIGSLTRRHSPECANIRPPGPVV